MAAVMLYGTAQTIFNSATDIATGNFSGAPTEYDNTSDAAYPNAPHCLLMAEFPDWAAAPTANSTVDVYMVVKNVDSTDDETDAPSGTSTGGAHYAGSFLLAATDGLQRRQIVVDMTGVKAADFYFMNNSGQNMNNDGGTNFIVKATPLTFGDA